MNDQHSCLVAKLSHYAELDESSRQFLMDLEGAEKTIESGRLIYRDGEHLKNLYVVRSGWLYSYMDLPDGERQIVQIHLPGDIIGFSGVAFQHQTITLQSVTETCLCPFEKTVLDNIFNKAPRLSALLFTVAVRDQVILTDLLRVIGCMSPAQRIAYLLLDVWSRLKITSPEMGHAYILPLNQSEIGDTIGLTNVSISQTMKKMETQGLIAREGNEVTLKQIDQLMKLCDFENRYDEMDVSWFPKVG